MPPHAPCRLQRFINSTDEIEVHLCLHTPRADCNQKMQSRCARQVLCLHTPRADCNISPCVVKGKEYRLCLHTPRADCNEKRPRLSACSMPLPPHAPCRLQRRFRSIWLTTSSFASTRPVQIATKKCNQDAQDKSFASTRPVQIATSLLVSLKVKSIGFASTRPVQIATRKGRD